MSTAKKSQTKNQSTSDPYFDQGRLFVLQQLLMARLDEMLDALGVDLRKSRKMYYGACPVHDGDNETALNLYTGGDVPGKWMCRTHHCQHTFKKSIIGFVRGVLSNKKGWTAPGDKQEATWHQAVDWCCEFIGQKIGELEVDNDEMEKRQFVMNMRTVARLPKGEGAGLTRHEVRKRLRIPSAYFVERGWSAQILDKYDIGSSDKAGKFLNRAIVPVYDNEYRYAVGYTARSIFDKCKSCDLYHSPKEKCPQTWEEQRDCSKWRNSDGFSRESYLYNYWFASKHIRYWNAVILVEGQGEVWRVEEAGIPISLGLFGCNLTETQQVALEMSGAMNVICLLNNDQAGIDGTRLIKEKLQRGFRLYFPQVPGDKNDLGQMTPIAVGELLMPLLMTIKNRGY